MSFAGKAGEINGLLKGLPDESRDEAVLQVMLAEALKTSEIEGEYLSRQDVMSSMRFQLGLSDRPEKAKDRASEGAAELMVAVRRTWSDPLDETSLFSWHRMLMKGESRMSAGAWRTGDSPMQVISNPYGKPRIHFEAPPSSQVPSEMAAFFDWFNQSASMIPHGPVRAAVAHLRFESIHPFEDGNGRIGRAIAEKALSQALGRPAVLSLSRAIEAGKKQYYDALETAQRSNEITPWIAYFADRALEAQTQAERQVEFVLRKARLFDAYRGRLSDRSRRVVERMLDEGPDGFEGGMNARKYVGLTKVSKATATRDLQELVAQGIFKAVGNGRSARYELTL